MKVTITFGELIDCGAWEEYCQMKGLDEWCVNEGKASDDEEAVLSEEEAEKLGLIKKGY